jgi:prevent-host-death family protein
VRTYVRATTNRKGAIAETAIAAEATKLGVSVLRPIVDHERYDLAFEIGSRILRVQCKWGALDEAGAVIKVSLQSCCLTPAGYVRTPYGPDEIDLVAVYCGDLDRCYLLPSSLACGRTSVYLRLTPPKKGQRASINLSTDFEFAGAVAQLEEHRHGMARVRGSSPLSSTSLPDSPNVVRTGSNQFRNHFGYYLERAAAGAEIHISRHGRPFARLLPAQDQLLAAA